MALIRVDVIFGVVPLESGEILGVMSDPIGRLERILCENGATTVAAVNALSRAERERLDASVYAWFTSFKAEHIRALTESPGLNLCLGIRKSIGDDAISVHGDVVVKKLTFFSQTGVLLTPKFRHPGCRKNIIPTSWYTFVLTYRQLIAAGMLSVLPKGATYLGQNDIIGETFIMKAERPRTVERNWFLFDEEIPSLKIVDLSEEALRRQMTEAGAQSCVSGTPTAYIRLPQFRHVPIGLLISLRRNHGDVFADYNLAMQSFFTGTSKAKTEKQLLAAMEKTDDEIRRIENELNRISATKTLQAKEIVVESACVGLCAYSNHPLLAAFFGGNLVPQLRQFIQLDIDRRALTRGTPFYFPWMVHRESKKISAARSAARAEIAEAA